MITQEENNVKLLSFPCKIEGIQNLNSDFLPSQFVSLIVGKPGSGKSFLMKNLVLHPSLFFKSFASVLILSPNPIVELECKLDENYKPIFDLPWIFLKISELNRIETSKVINVLIIFDDMIGELKKHQNDVLLMNLFFNRRHLLKNGTISFIITTQKYILTPVRIRSILTWVFVFKVMPTDWDKIKQECIFSENKILDVIVDHIFKQEYDFVNIRLDTSEIYYNFNRLKI